MYLPGLLGTPRPGPAVPIPIAHAKDVPQPPSDITFWENTWLHSG